MSEPLARPCTGLLGALFGHTTEPRFHVTEPGPARVAFLLEHPSFSPESGLPPRPAAETFRTYAGEVCTRCGQSFPAHPDFARMDSGALSLMEALAMLRRSGMPTVFDPRIFEETGPEEKRRRCFISCLEIVGEISRDDPVHLLLESGDVHPGHPLTRLAADVAGGETARFALPSYARALGVSAREGKRYQDIALASVILYECVAGMTEEQLAAPGYALVA